MNTITDLMTHEHRACDVHFADAERAAQRGDWVGAERHFKHFATALEAHFGTEETRLFPAFEAATGMTHGPTQMMRMEHTDMREQLDDMRAALTGRDADAYAGESETLLILMQQHNMKEENILYPMCDGHLGADLPDLLQHLTLTLHGDQP